MGVFASKPANPATVPTDTIIPLHWQDDNKTFRSFILEFSVCFNDVLDPEKVRGSLARLVEMGEWRKLGSRLRLNDSGKLEYHIPERFDEKRPAFRYSHVKFEMSASEHPLASQLPKSTSRPTVLHSNSVLAPLLRDKDGPTKLDDYLYADVGQLSLRIVSFNDATILSLTWPHTFLDAMGRRSLFDAWISVLNGRESEVKPLLGFDTDPLENFGSKPTESYALEKRQLKGFAFFTFVVRMIFELVWYRKEDTRTVCVPAAYLNSMKVTALSELSTYSDVAKLFLSDGDVICAWWARLALSHVMARESKRTVVIMNAMGLRSALANDLLPPGKAYVSNAVVCVQAIIPAHELLTRPLCYTAIHIRKSIQEQGTRAQLEAVAALNRENMAGGGQQPIFGDGSTKLIVFSNWTKANFFELDFSAAVVKQGERHEERSNALGKPFYIQAGGHSNGVPSRYSFPILGKDAGGNYWLSGVLRTETWEKLEEDFKNKM